MAFCANCGRQLEEGSDYCIYCGKEIGSGGSYAGNGNRSSSHNGRNNRTAIIAVAIAIVCIVALVVVLAVFLLGPQPEDSETPQGQQETGQQAIVNDTSKPFWGAWASTFGSKAQADDYAETLTKGGFDSTVILSSDWENLDPGRFYIVTVGTWATEIEAEEMVEKLKKAGYTDAHTFYTGVVRTGQNIVTLNAKTASGEGLTGTVQRDSNDYVIADSSSREYGIDELRAMDLTPAELCIAWNEPFARLGYHFKNPSLQAYFEATDWYVDQGKSFNLSGVAAINNSNLRQLAEENEESKKWEDLATS